MKIFKVGAYSFLAVVAFIVPAYWWLLVENGTPLPDYSIDIAQIRRLANSQSEEKPLDIRVETVAHLSTPTVLAGAGTSWQMLDLPVSAYELEYPRRSVILDTALDANVARLMDASRFDADAYARVQKALARAALILVTHEHPDHIGGLLASRNVKKLLAATVLSQEQVVGVRAGLNADPLAAAHPPAGLLDGYRPLQYARYHAIAPGMVLIKAPGHTEGSQMVYVRRTDGVEFLFLGDVAWRMRNVEVVRERARLMTWLGNEDRNEVQAELVALHDLHAQEPGLHMIPGHDDGSLNSLVDQGLLHRGF
jgi:glyoxylase-like metal-dependent hydrolase (beta-lactamase superfamily II)